MNVLMEHINVDQLEPVRIFTDHTYVTVDKVIKLALQITKFVMVYYLLL